MSKDYIQYEKYSKGPFEIEPKIEFFLEEKRFSWRHTNGYYHRIGGPCFVSKSERSYCRDGKIHRLNAPAIYTLNNIQYIEFDILISRIML
jgi:hypothetical protein